MIKYFVGAIGSGKTTFAIKFALQEMYGKRFTLLKKALGFKPKNIVYTNFENTLKTRLFNANDLSIYKPCEKALVLLDESGIEFNSREFKTMKKGIIEYFKMSRHNKNDVYMFSQTFDDTDKMIRDLATEIWLCRKCGPITIARKVICSIGIDKDKKQLMFQHEFIPMWHQLLPFQPKQFKFIFRPLYYRYFNSFSPLDREDMPYKDNAIGGNACSSAI